MFLFLKPFSSKLWMVIAGTLLATGAAVYYMEWGNQFDFEPELKEAPNGTPLALVGLLKSTWLTCMRFTGSDGHDPDSWPGRWLVGFYFLVVMTITATYTAALANDFSDAVSVQTGVGDVTDFVTQHMPACVLGHSALETWAAYNLPSVKFVKLENYAALFRAMGANKCAGLLDTQTDTLSYQVPNDACDGYTWIGHELVQFKSGFVGRLQQAEINRVIERRLHSLRETGFLSNIIDEFFKTHHYHGCASELESELTLEPIHLAGLILCYLAVLLIATFSQKVLPSAITAKDIDIYRNSEMIPRRRPLRLKLKDKRAAKAAAKASTDGDGERKNAAEPEVAPQAAAEERESRT